MEDASVYPYRFPTTAVLVDDNADFLVNFSLELDARLAYRLFDSPQMALNFLNRQQPSPLFQRCFSQHRDIVGWSPTDQLIRFDVSELEREVGNVHRFGEVSVLVVDYDMPGMDGLEFCRRVKNKQIKKILFTGVGDEKVAVEAFNQGIIDRFLLKSHREVGRLVNQAIRELQSEYFRDASYMIRESLRLESPNFLEDPIFADYFQGVCEDNDFVEYYYAAEPGGFLLSTADGSLGRLLVFTQQDLQAQIEIAQDQGAPGELLNFLRSGRMIPYFWTTGGYFKPELADWQDFLYPAHTIEARQLYHVALVEEPAAYAENRRQMSSFTEYLDWLDMEGHVTA